MVKLQIDMPDKLSKKVKVYSAKNEFVSQTDAVLFLLEKALRDEK